MRHFLTLCFIALSYASFAQVLTLSIVEQSDPTCFNASDGAVTVEAMNGSAPFSYELVNVVVQDNGTFEGLSGGDYIIVVTDSDDNMAEVSFTLTSPLPISLEIDATDPTCIDAQDGTLTITELNNLPGVEFSISGPSQASNSTGIFNDLGIGTYIIFASTSPDCQVVISTVLSSDIECEEEEEFTIEVATQMDPSCSDSDDGTFLIEPLNGTAPFTYNLDNSVDQDNGLFEGLSSGSYNVVATDANGNTAEVGIVLEAPLAIALDITINDPSCIDSLNGSIIVTEINNIDITEYTISGALESSNTTGIFTGLGVGAYMVSASNSAGCEEEITATLSSDNECEEEDLCPMTFSKVGIQINKIDEDLFDLVVLFAQEKDIITGITYDQLYNIVEFHILNRKVFLTALSDFKFENYCANIEKYRSDDYIQSTTLSLQDLDYIELQEIAKIQDLLSRIGKSECIKI